VQPERRLLINANTLRTLLCLQTHPHPKRVFPGTTTPTDRRRQYSPGTTRNRGFAG
jgi:hypothetical protein